MTDEELRNRVEGHNANWFGTLVLPERTIEVRADMPRDEMWAALVWALTKLSEQWRQP